MLIVSLPHYRKAQYIRKFKQWNFEKNSTKEKWKFSARCLKERKLDDKESETYINGKLIPRKKVKKEVSRYYMPSTQQISDTGMISKKAEQVVKRLIFHSAEPCPSKGSWKQRERTEPAEYCHIPWFEFEALVEPQCLFRPILISWKLSNIYQLNFFGP